MRLVVGPANDAFSPTAADLESARRVCAACDQTAGLGAMAVDGKMIDLPGTQRARNTLARECI